MIIFSNYLKIIAHRFAALSVYGKIAAISLPVLAGAAGVYTVQKLTADKGLRTRGMVFDTVEFGKIPLYMRLDSALSPLPTAVSLEQYCPRRLNQGDQESCVAWATAYAARTIMAAQHSTVSPNKLAFSPSFLYNQAQRGACQPTQMVNILTLLSKGLLPMSDFGYNPNDCHKQPSSEQKARAVPFRCTDFQRLTYSATDTRVDMLAIKQLLSQGIPVVIGAAITPSFENLEDATWHPTAGEEVLGGHAMCVIGYDDKHEGGAFRLMNSWGNDWGERGLAWVRYGDFAHFCKEAYSYYVAPTADSTTVATALDVQVGLADIATKSYIPLKNAGNNYTFVPAVESPEALHFRVEIRNKKDCYTYVLRRSAAEQEQILFPYSEQYSAYCGVTGARQFPHNDQLSIADHTGTEEVAIIVSRRALNYAELQRRIKQGKGSYAERVRQALGTAAIATTAIRAEGDLLHISSPTSAQTDMAVAILEVRKAEKDAPPPPAKPQVVIATTQPDTLFLFVKNKQQVGNFLEFDVAIRGAMLRGGGNYVSSLEIELGFDDQFYNAQTGSKIVVTPGKSFTQATLVGKKWLPSYTTSIRTLASNRVRISLLMNYYSGASHIRSLLSASHEQAIHVRIPLDGCKTKSSKLRFLENPNITVGTYVPEMNSNFGESIAYLRHIFLPINGENDVSGH